MKIEPHMKLVVEYQMKINVASGNESRALKLSVMKRKNKLK
jgi:hypothetical protein